MSSSDEEYDDMPQLTKEKERFLIKKAHKIGRYSSYYIIDINWWNAWTKHSNGEGETPGTLDNSRLFDENGVIKKNLKEDEDYISVDKETMSLILHLYGAKNEYIHKGMLTSNNQLDIYPLKLKLLHRGDLHNFEFPASESPENLKKVLCSSLHQNPNLASLWRIPKEVDHNKYTEDEIFPLLDEENLTVCGIEEGDVLKLDTEKIQSEENINFAAKIKNKLNTGGEGDSGEEDGDEGPRGAMGGMGGMRGMGGMGGMQGMNIMMMMMGMGGGMGYEDMENDHIKRAIKESLEFERKKEEEKKKQEEEELRKKKEQEEIELQRKKIQEFANKDSSEDDDDEDNYDPIDPNNLSDDDEDDDDEDGDDDDDDSDEDN